MVADWSKLRFWWEILAKDWAMWPGRCAFEPKELGATFLLAHDMMIVTGWVTPERRGTGRV